MKVSYRHLALGAAGAASIGMASLLGGTALSQTAAAPDFKPRRDCPVAAPAVAAAQPTPAPAAPATAVARSNLPDPVETGGIAARPNPFDTRIVVVEWKIKAGRECDFLEYWATRATVGDRSGLIGEFLSEVDAKPWIRWPLAEGSTTYYNVGIWKNADAFQDQIGKFIDNNRPPLEFEADKRGRVFLAPERWRIGMATLPGSDPAGVR